MARIALVFASLSSLLLFPLLDSAIKGTVVLLLAGIVTFALRRDSAATRHCIWTITVVLLLAMPVLSVVLPQWRVLPSWADTTRPVSAVEPVLTVHPANAVVSEVFTPFEPVTVPMPPRPDEQETAATDPRVTSAADTLPPQLSKPETVRRATMIRCSGLAAV